MNNDILDDVIKMGKMCKSCLLDLDTESSPLQVQYIKLDDDLINQWCNNTKDAKFVQFAYNTIMRLLDNKYKSDNLSIFYKNKRLKLVYIVNNDKYTATLI